MSENLHHVIGIDLGTTYSAVASFDIFTERPEIIFDPTRGGPDGATTPSVVWANQHRVVVGETARQAIAMSPADTVIEIKREMGESFTEQSLSSFQAAGKYPVGAPVKVNFCGAWRWPQEISAFILMRMKAIAEAELGTEVHDAVVTVPAYFKAQQKKATEEAALLAGLYPRQLIPEPTAAAICYGVDKGDPERKVYLVYDLGGGTFDVSIIEARDEEVTVLATSGDPRLGGSDFDNAITRWAMKQLGVDPRADPGLARKIKTVAEAAKRNLSYFEQAELVLPTLANGTQPRPLTLTRSEFESLIKEDLSKSLTFVDQAVQSAKEDKDVERIDAILLVGGSTRIPLVRKMLIEHFGEDEGFVRADADPDAVVARGAAIMAHRFAPSERFELRRRPEAGLVNPDLDGDIKVELITEHTLGVGVQEGKFDPLIKRGTPLPAEQTKDDYTNPGPTDTIKAPVYQGEGRFVYENTLIGTVDIPVEPREQGYHRFAVTFRLDENGLFSVLVKHLNTGKDYPAMFDQQTAVGGDEALELQRLQLLELYDDTQLATVAAAAPPAPAAPSIPPPVPGPSPSVTPPVTAAAEPAATAVADGPDPGLVEANVDIPEEFRQIVRRARKLLLTKPVPALAEALNVFIAALNAGAPADKLEELGDDLADVFDDARH